MTDSDPIVVRSSALANLPRGVRAGRREALSGWLLIPLGQAALYVYAVHAVLVFYVLAGLALFQQLEGR
jgi:hypothetical protein